MNATLFGMLADEGRISYDDKSRTWPTDHNLEELFLILAFQRQMEILAAFFEINVTFIV